MDKFDTSTIYYPSELYAEVVEIVQVWGLKCEYTSAINSQWGWQGATTLTITQVADFVMVEFEDWVMDFLLEESGCSHACPIIYFNGGGDFRLFCHQLVHGMPRDESVEDETAE